MNLEEQKVKIIKVMHMFKPPGIMFEPPPLPPADRSSLVHCLTTVNIAVVSRNSQGYAITDVS